MRLNRAANLKVLQRGAFADSQSIFWVFTAVAEQVSRIMAPEEQSAKTFYSVLNDCSQNLGSFTGCVSSYFLFISVSVTPFKDTLRLTMVALKEAGVSRVEEIAFCTAQGPVSISVATAFR